MKKIILTLIAGTTLTAGLLTSSCRGKVTIHSDKGTDTIEFNTDSIHEININGQLKITKAEDKVQGAGGIEQEDTQATRPL